LQIALRKKLSPAYREFTRILHTKLHKPLTNRKIMKENQIIVLTMKTDGRTVQSDENPQRPATQFCERWGTHPENDGVMAELVAYVDGGSLGNPGPSGIGVVISGLGSGPVRIAKWIGHQDNNVAEYAALMEALQYAVSSNARTLHVYSDSQVVVRQMTGEYTCRSPRLYSLHWTCRKLARALKFSISHVPRERNAEANRLAQAALRKRKR
jgi:ribonuclease HI